MPAAISIRTRDGKDSEEILRIRINALIVEGQLARAQELTAITPAAEKLLPDHRRHPGTFIAINMPKPWSFSMALRKRLASQLLRSSSCMPNVSSRQVILTVLKRPSKPFRTKVFTLNRFCTGLAQIELGRGNSENGLKFLQKIVEKGGDSLWQRYAAKDLEYIQSTERLRRKLE